MTAGSHPRKVAHEAWVVVIEGIENRPVANLIAEMVGHLPFIGGLGIYVTKYVRRYDSVCIVLPQATDPEYPTEREHPNDIP